MKGKEEVKTILCKIIFNQDDNYDGRIVPNPFSMRNHWCLNEQGETKHV